VLRVTQNLEGHDNPTPRKLLLSQIRALSKSKSDIVRMEEKDVSFVLTDPTVQNFWLIMFCMLKMSVGLCEG
jgi:hypothetical protein